MGQDLSRFTGGADGNPEGDKLSSIDLKKREIKRVDQEIRKKFKKGVQYNVRVVIRGARRVGKTSLLNRLQGKAFENNYNPTEQITNAHIHWNYKSYDDAVVVEVWDVVDKSLKSEKEKTFEALRSKSYDSLRSLQKEEMMKEKMEEFNSSGANFNYEDEDDAEDDGSHVKFGSHVIQQLDATTIDVYKQAQAAVFMFDVTQPQTFDYVRKEIFKAPPNVDVVVCGNFRDKQDEIQVSHEEIMAFINSFNQRIRDVKLKRMNKNTQSQIPKMGETSEKEEEKPAEEENQSAETPKAEIMTPQSPQPLNPSLKTVESLENEGLVKVSDEFWVRSELRYLDCSMRNCFGLKQLYTYFNLPFLHLKIRSYEDQLKSIESEYFKTREDAQAVFGNGNYADYLKTITRPKPIPAVPVTLLTTPRTPASPVPQTVSPKQEKPEKLEKIPPKETEKPERIPPKEAEKPAPVPKPKRMAPPAQPFPNFPPFSTPQPKVETPKPKPAPSTPVPLKVEPPKPQEVKKPVPKVEKPVQPKVEAPSTPVQPKVAIPTPVQPKVGVPTPVQPKVEAPVPQPSMFSKYGSQYGGFSMEPFKPVAEIPRPKTVKSVGANLSRMTDFSESLDDFYKDVGEEDEEKERKEKAKYKSSKTFDENDEDEDDEKEKKKVKKTTKKKATSPFPAEEATEEKKLKKTSKKKKEDGSTATPKISEEEEKEKQERIKQLLRQAELALAANLPQAKKPEKVEPSPSIISEKPEKKKKKTIETPEILTEEVAPEKKKKKKKTEMSPEIIADEPLPASIPIRELTVDKKVKKLKKKPSPSPKDETMDSFLGQDEEEEKKLKKKLKKKEEKPVPPPKEEDLNSFLGPDDEDEKKLKKKKKKEEKPATAAVVPPPKEEKPVPPPIVEDLDSFLGPDDEDDEEKEAKKKKKLKKKETVPVPESGGEIKKKKKKVSVGGSEVITTPTIRESSYNDL